MTRIVAATCLMVVQLAGPLLCCCATTRHDESTGTARSQPSSSSHSCCGHDGPKQSNSDPKTPDHERPACPCQQNPTGAVLTADAEFAPHALLRHLSHDASSVPALLTADCCVWVAGLSAPAPECLALPFLSADELLHALHILRC